MGYEWVMNETLVDINEYQWDINGISTGYQQDINETSMDINEYQWDINGISTGHQWISTNINGI